MTDDQEALVDAVEQLIQQRDQARANEKEVSSALREKVGEALLAGVEYASLRRAFSDTELRKIAREKGLGPKKRGPRPQAQDDTRS